MTTIENIETSNEMKEQLENMKNLLGHFFFFFQKRKPVLKEKRSMKKEWLRKEGARKTENFRR